MDDIQRMVNINQIIQVKMETLGKCARCTLTPLKESLYENFINDNRRMHAV